MTTKKQINFTPKKISSLLTAITIFLSMIILIAVSIFLYKNFYQAITQTKEIMVLQGKVALYSVDLKKFDLIIDKLTIKTLPKKLGSINNPFH